MAIRGVISEMPNMEATIPAQDETSTWEKVHWASDPGLRRLYFHVSILLVTPVTTGYGGTFFNTVQNFEPWREAFGHPDGSMLGLLGAFYQIGSIVSIPFVPWLADHLGRKFPILIGCIILVVGAVVQGTATSLGVFIGGRVLLGFGNSLTQIASPMLLTELCHPQHRGRLTTVYNCLWNVGSLLVSWIAFGTNYLNSQWSWRVPAILQAVPSLVQLLFIYWVPESPRYLIVKDRHDEALAFFTKYHGNGDAHSSIVQFEYRKVKETLQLEFMSKRNSTYVDFLKTKGNRYRLIILISLGLFSQWSGNAIISNYTSVLYDSVGITDSTQKLGLAAGQAVLALIVSSTMAMTIDRFGRRPLFLTATSGMFVVFIFWTLTAGLYEDYNLRGSNYAMVFFVWLFGFMYSIAWSGLVIGYAIEILPYRLRAKGIMIMTLSIQAALTLNIYVNPVAFKGFGNQSWKLYLIYTCWSFLELCFVYCMYVETKGATLEEVTKVIDGEDALVAPLAQREIDKEADHKI
ncbi:putative General substrate transporter [Seiridium cardinale]